MSHRIEIIKSELISIGRSGFIGDESPLITYFPYGSNDAYRIYEILPINALSDCHLTLLFKGLVIAEKELSWKCGSTTPAAHIYQHIDLRGLDIDYSLADWAFQYSDNEYVPFGFIRHGERTAYEYIQWREDLHARICQEQLDASNRKMQQLKRAREIQEKKRQTDALARNLYQKIRNLPPNEQIHTIVNDSEHNILFYMPVINVLMKRSDVSHQDWRVLLRQLFQLKVTPFNKRLINKIVSKLQL